MQDISMVSPDTIFNIAKKIKQKLLDTKENLGDIEWYISRWREVYYGWNDEITGCNFEIIRIPDSPCIHIMETLQPMSNELLFKIAVDLDIEIPGLMYGVAEIKGILNDRYDDVGRKFEEACKEVYSAPDMAILKANSALERLIKEICKDKSIKDCNPKDTLYKLTEHILKEFKFFPDKKLNSKIKNIGSGLLTTTQAIEGIRSSNTKSHGTLDEIIAQPLYSVFVVNSVATVGLFLLNYYEHHYKPTSSLEDDEIPF